MEKNINDFKGTEAPKLEKDFSPLSIETMSKVIKEISKNITDSLSSTIVVKEIFEKLHQNLEESRPVIFGCPIIVIPEEYIPKQEGKKFLFGLIYKSSYEIVPNIKLYYSDEKE